MPGVVVAKRIRDITDSGSTKTCVLTHISGAGNTSRQAKKTDL